jgi:hypothetical protein
MKILPPTRRAARPAEIERPLRGIDAKSGRPARAVVLAAASGNAPESADVERLEALAAEAKALRAELAGL